MRDAAAAVLAPAEIAPAPVALDLQAEFEDVALPPDLPAWPRDGLAISQRVRAVLATLEPVVVRVRTFWDHAVRSVVLGGGRQLEVDPAGCYRLR